MTAGHWDIADCRDEFIPATVDDGCLLSWFFPSRFLAPGEENCFIAGKGDLQKAVHVGSLVSWLKTTGCTLNTIKRRMRRLVKL